MGGATSGTKSTTTVLGNRKKEEKIPSKSTKEEE
jgi:hypothetical protein